LSTLGAFADDVAAVVVRLLDTLRDLAPAFAIFAQASGLKLNPKKTLIIPIGKLEPKDVRAFLQNRIPEWADMKVRRAGKLLGVAIGPEAQRLRWKDAGKKYWATSRASKASAGGFWQALRHYRVFAFSVLCHIAQFDEIPNDIRKMEGLALQCLTKGPFNTFTVGSLQCLTDIGASFEAPSLTIMNRAALVRNACSSAAFFRARHRFQNDELDDEALIVKRSAAWSQTSVFLRMLAAYEATIALPIQLETLPASGFQRALTAAFRKRVPTPWPALLRRRLRRWIPDATEEVACRALNNMRVAFAICPQTMVLALLRVVLNGLPTSARQQGGRTPCLLCGWAEGDCIEHIVHCPALRPIVSEILPHLASWEGPVRRHLAICLQFPAADVRLLREVITYGDVLYAVHTRRRHMSPALPADLARARIRQTRLRYGLSVFDEAQL
jgi:hypothetical protein